MIELQALKDLLPKTQRGLVTEELVDKLNQWNEDPKLVESFKENLLGFTNVLKDGKYKLDDYFNAVRFVSYKLLGYTDIDAYTVVFPERYERLRNDGLERTEIGAYCTAYKKNKLVVAIMEQTLVPTHVLNAPLYQEALNELASIMTTSRSDMARVNAATAILAHTKAPEITKIELDIGVKETSAIEDLRKATEELVLAQRKSIEAGVAVKQIAESTIIEAELDDE
jgi:hypothetical protein